MDSKMPEAVKEPAISVAMRRLTQAIDEADEALDALQSCVLPVSTEEQGEAIPSPLRTEDVGTSGYYKAVSEHAHRVHHLAQRISIMRSRLEI